MSLYDDASLIAYPSGYKSGVIYSQKPTDGSGDLTFTRASTATRVNESGLIESVASGVPRIDYTGGGCGKFKFEPQSTNGITQSEDFSNAYWDKDQITVTGGQSAPDGTNNAFLVAETAINSAHRVIELSPRSFPIGEKAAATIHLKYNGTVKFIEFVIGSLTGNPDFIDRSISINIETGTIVRDTSYEATAKIVALADDWYAVSFVMDAPSATVTNRLYVSALDNSQNAIYLGNPSNNFLIFGAQIEQNASYPTSYIPTSGATSTRLVDTARGLYNGDGIFGTNWAAFCELVVPYEGNSGTGAGFGAKTVEGATTPSNFSFALAHQSDSQLNLATFSPQTEHFIDYTFGDTLKILVRSDGFYFVNGVKYTLTGLSATEPVEIGFGRLGQADFSVGETCEINNTIIFNTAQSDAKCIELTTI